MIGTFGLNTCPDTTRCLSSELDFYIVDREHGRASLSEASMLLASISNGCKRFVRVSSSDRVEIQRVLELNPDGILVPQISSFEEAADAISHSFFQPLGTRGLSPYTRGFDFHHADLEDKKKKLNKNLKLGLLIEGESGFEALPSIIENLSDSIHLIYFGLFDFANSMRVQPDWSDQNLAETLSDVISTAASKGVAVGTIARSREDIELLEGMGVMYIVYLNDLGIIKTSLQHLKSC